MKNGKQPFPIHPGQILREEYLKPQKIKPKKLAKAIGVSTKRVREILKGKKRIGPKTALRLSRYFGDLPEFWLNLQNQYDLTIAKRNIRKELERIEPR